MSKRNYDHTDLAIGDVMRPIVGWGGQEFEVTGAACNEEWPARCVKDGGGWTVGTEASFFFQYGWTRVRRGPAPTAHPGRICTDPSELREGMMVEYTVTFGGPVYGPYTGRLERHDVDDFDLWIVPRASWAFGEDEVRAGRVRILEDAPGVTITAAGQSGTGTLRVETDAPAAEPRKPASGETWRNKHRSGDDIVTVEKVGNGSVAYHYRASRYHSSRSIEAFLEAFEFVADAPAAETPAVITPRERTPQVGDVWRRDDNSEWLVLSRHPDRKAWLCRCVRSSRFNPAGHERDWAFSRPSDWSLVTPAPTTSEAHRPPCVTAAGNDPCVVCHGAPTTAPPAPAPEAPPAPPAPICKPGCNPAQPCDERGCVARAHLDSESEISDKVEAADTLAAMARDIYGDVLDVREARTWRAACETHTPTGVDVLVGRYRVRR